MWVQAAGLFLTALHAQLRLVACRQRAARRRNGDGLSEPDRGGLRCLASDLARALAQRLSLLARSRLCHRRAAAGIIADAFGFVAAIAAVGILTFVSGVVAAIAMKEPTKS